MSDDKGLVRAPGRITKEQVSFLETLVADGRYGSVSEALRAAVENFNMPKTESAFYIGEALLGDGNELAHVDLMIGDKDGMLKFSTAALRASLTDP